ncbi:MAG: hypothetical protein C4K47_09210 [Candidatus Thorarchaeota archaeon]|nr:MAG: hypothetical protein C4K47_09210 [Candidatus Thorarchaeota archaeon]
MSLQERIPKQLRLGDSIIGIALDEDVGVFPTSEYVLLEISPTAEKINVLKIASTIQGLVRNDKRIVAIRGYGFKGIGLAVRVAHELKVREQRFRYEMAFDTFDASDKEGKTLTSVQIVVMPPS